MRNNKGLPGYAGDSYKLVEGYGCGLKSGPEKEGFIGTEDDSESKVLNDQVQVTTDKKLPVGYDVIRKLPASMGPYDGLCLQTGNKEAWMKNPYNVSLVPNDSLFTYLGSQGPLKPVFSDNSAYFGPPVDGKPGSPKKMFMFANNRTSPDCCPGTFSTSTGCVCTTENQRDFIASRGNQGSISLENI